MKEMKAISNHRPNKMLPQQFEQILSIETLNK